MGNPDRYAVEWTLSAGADLAAIIEHIAADAPTTAQSVLAKIERRAKTLETLPLRGRIVPELAASGVRLYRELIVSPWRMIYRVSGKTVYVLAVLDSRRNLEDLLLERFLR